MAFARAVLCGDLIKACVIFDAASEDERRVIANEHIMATYTSAKSLSLIHFLLARYSQRSHGFFSMMERIVKYADLNDQNQGGRTPLNVAVRGKMTEVALLLIESGADTTIPDCDDVMPIHLANYSVDTFRALLVKKPNFDARTSLPNKKCETCRSSRGHTVHCFVYTTDDPNIARMAFEYAEAMNYINYQNVMAYVQMFVRFGDIPILEHIIKTYRLDPAYYVFEKRIDAHIPNRFVATFLAKHNLLSKEYADWVINNASFNNDLDLVLILIACGGNTYNVKIVNMAACSRVRDIIALLIAAGGVTISLFDIKRLDTARKSTSTFLANNPSAVDKPVSNLVGYFPSHIPKDMTVGDFFIMRLRNIDAINELLYISLLWVECQRDLPELFDLVKFEEEKRMWRQRVDDAKRTINEFEMNSSCDP